MDAFPAFFPLTDATVAIAGDGEGAQAKVRLLAGSPARIVRLAGAEALDPRSYAGVKLVFVAGVDAAFRLAAAAAARAAGAAVNVFDEPSQSDFYVPALIDRGKVVAAIGTSGAAPMLASLLRTELEARIPEGLGALADLLGAQREAIRKAFPDIADRRAFLRQLLEGPAAEAALAGDLATAGARLEAALAAAKPADVKRSGKVWLIEAPAARDLLTLRAARILSAIDLLAAGDGVSAGLLALARRDAPRKPLADIDAPFLAATAGAGRQAALLAGPEALTPFAEMLEGGDVAWDYLAPGRPGRP